MTSVPPKPHLQIYNPAFRNGEAQFARFPSLPRELRLMVWELALDGQRIIKVALEGPKEQEETRKLHPKAFPEGSERCCAVVSNGPRVTSGLLSANSESRGVALRFYRVPIPCSFSRGKPTEGPRKSGVLHFNPEHDFLQIKSGASAKDTFVEFLWRLKIVYDPRRVGLLNLAVDPADLVGGHDLSRFKLSSLPPHVKTYFLETMTQLREVFLVFSGPVGRQSTHIFDAYYNRSFPVMTTTSSFERIEQDPRAIAQDLRNVLVAHDLPNMLRVWMRRLHYWKIPQNKNSACRPRLLMSFEPPEEIADRAAAEKRVREEDANWTGARRDSGEDSIYDVFKLWPHENLEKAVRPAFGFWLFPMEVVLTLKGRGRHFDRTWQWDLTNHRPELCLFDLP